MFDESTRMLSREVMLAYLFGELSPSLRQDVDNFLSNDEMHRDIIEGLRQLGDRSQIERALESINQRVAGRSGAEAHEGGISAEMPAFLSDYRKIAAIAVGALAVSGIIIAIMLMRQPATPAGSGKEEPSKEIARTNLADKPASPPKPVEKIIPAAEETASSLRSENILQTDVKKIDDKAERERKKNEAAKTESRTAPSVARDTIPKTAGNPVMEGTTQEADRAVENQDIKSEDAGLDYLTAGQSKAIEKSKEQETKALESEPEFPGGEAALQQYLRSNMKYPPAAKEKGIEGKVYVSFYIGTSGRVKDIRVVKGVSKEINAEAIRLLSNMPAWKPGTQNGKPVSMKQLVIVDFSLD